MSLLLVLLHPDQNVKTVTDHLSNLKLVSNWFSDFPNSIFVETSLNAKQLFTEIEAIVGKNRTLVLRIKGKIPTDVYGLMIPSHWKAFYEAIGYNQELNK